MDSGRLVRCGLRPLGFLLLAVGAAAQGTDSPPAAATQLVAGHFDRPVFVTSPPGDSSRLFVLEQATGHIRLVSHGVLLAEPFLDLGGKVNTLGGERGLLGLAFHPQYAANGKFFVDYTNTAGDVVVERYATLDRDHGNPASGQILLHVPEPTQVHQGGMLAFAPDGMLIIATGDGGVIGLDNQASSTSSLLGKLLRVDVDSGVPYAIPADNPWAGVPGAKGEIWARGLRNPWRFSFDRLGGDLYLSDVGEGEFEEVNWMPAGTAGGAHFGWNCLEGLQCTGQPGCTCPMTQVVAPLGGYTHDEGCAIIGGYVYRGSKLPQLVGSYLYADYCGGKVWSLRHDGMQVTSVTDLTDQLDPALGQFGPLSSFGEDADGELYIVGYALGKVWKIVPAAAVPDCDGDGVPDADEIAAGTAFDHDADGMPDSCELQLTAGEVVAGKLTKLQFLGGAPGEPVLFFYTTRGIGPGPCWFGGAVCLQLLPPVGLLGGVAVNSAGVALLVVPVPAGTPAGVEVDFQALLYKGTQSVTSNPVIHVTQS